MRIVLLRVFQGKNDIKFRNSAPFDKYFRTIEAPVHGWRFSRRVRYLVRPSVVNLATIAFILSRSTRLRCVNTHFHVLRLKYLDIIVQIGMVLYSCYACTSAGRKYHAWPIKNYCC